MILSEQENKISAYKKAKELVRNTLQGAFFCLEKDPENTRKMTEKEKEEIMKHIETLVIGIEKQF